jgi:hypothetical protein
LRCVTLPSYVDGVNGVAMETGELLSPVELHELQAELLDHVRNSRHADLPADDAEVLLLRAVYGRSLREVLAEREPRPEMYEGRSLVQHALAHGSAALIRALLQVGATPPVPDPDGNTQAHYAALALELQSLVVAVSVPPGGVAARNAEQRTPLHCAAMQGGEECVNVLAAMGAEIDARDADGRTPRDLAQAYGHIDVVQALNGRAALNAVYAAHDPRASARGQRLVVRQHFDGPRNGRRAVTAAATSEHAAASSEWRVVSFHDGRRSVRVGRSWEDGAAPTVERSARLPAICRHFARGGCVHGAACRFAHVDAQLLPAVVVGGGVAAAHASGARAFAPRPFPQLGLATNSAFDAHAEALAAAYMRWLGFADATVTGGIHEADGGIDVQSRDAVAQVKANVRAAVPRAHLSQFKGDTATLPGSPKLLFFAMREYTPDAIDYASKPQVRMCLFRMDVHGCVEAANDAACALVAARGR